MAEINLSVYKTAYDVLKKVIIGKQFLTETLSDAINNCPDEREKLTFICYGTMEKLIEIDYILSKFVTKTTKPQINVLLQMGVFLTKYSNSPNYAVVNNMAELSKIMFGKTVCGFVNATLKSACNSIDLPQDELQKMSVQHSFPLWAINKYVATYGIENTKKLVEFQSQSLEHIRLRCDRQEFFDYCEKKKTIANSSPLSNGAYVDFGFLIRNKFDKTKYIKQNYGSMKICEMAKIMQNPTKILDVCSAPGGKSCYLADIFPSAVIFACDTSESRKKLIDNYVERLNISNVATFVQDGTVLRNEWQNSFDLVLCDNPCSGFGTVYSKPDIKFFKQEKDVQSLANISYKILKNAQNYVKFGGYLLFSTCSLFREENEFVLEKFKKEFENFVEIDRMKISPITENNEGFFAVLLQKKVQNDE